MPRKKGAPNISQNIIDEIITKHKNGHSKRELAIVKYQAICRNRKNILSQLCALKHEI